MDRWVHCFDGGPESGLMNRRKFLAMTAGAAAAGGGAIVTRAAWGGGPKLSLYPLDEAAGPPAGVRLGIQRVIWSVESNEPLVALTFDDGPDPELTPRVLDVLDSYGLTATFFVMGHSVTRDPSLVLETVTRGHEIGNHTWTHVDLTRQRPEDARLQLALCQHAVRSAAGVVPKYFRPPRGLLSGAATRHAAESDSDIVLWSVGRGVSGVGTPRTVARHVVGEVEAGDIVLLHDGVGRESLRSDDGPRPVRRRREVEIAALREIIEGVLAKGLRPTTVSGLLAMAGTTDEQD